LWIIFFRLVATKFLTIIIMILFNLNIVIGQSNLFYVNKDHHYSILINKQAEITRKDLHNGYIEYFLINNEESIFKYLLTITRVEQTSQINIYNEEYFEAFNKECDCEATNPERVIFNNFDGLKIQIVSEVEGRLLSGYSISTAQNDALYTVSLLSLKKNQEDYELIFHKVLNSLVFNN